MRWTGLYSYICNQCNDDMASLVGRLPRQKSMANVKDFPNGISSQISMTKVSLQVGRHHLWFDLEMDGLRHTQNTLCINDCFTGYQSNYVEGTGQELSCTATLSSHLVIRWMVTERKHFAITQIFKKNNYVRV